MLEGDVTSRAAAALGAGMPVIFRVPGVRFRFEGAAHDRWPER
jgi:hypothetical protein